MATYWKTFQRSKADPCPNKNGGPMDRRLKSQLPRQMLLRCRSRRLQQELLAVDEDKRLSACVDLNLRLLRRCRSNVGRWCRCIRNWCCCSGGGYADWLLRHDRSTILNGWKRRSGRVCRRNHCPAIRLGCAWESGNGYRGRQRRGLLVRVCCREVYRLALRRDAGRLGSCGRRAHRGEILRRYNRRGWHRRSVLRDGRRGERDLLAVRCGGWLN